VREMVLPRIERHGPMAAWIIDDTGLPKKGRLCVPKTLFELMDVMESPKLAE
jgi:SRSO17 transposase